MAWLFSWKRPEVKETGHESPSIVLWCASDRQDMGAVWQVGVFQWWEVMRKVETKHLKPGSSQEKQLLRVSRQADDTKPCLKYLTAARTTPVCDVCETETCYESVRVTGPVEVIIKTSNQRLQKMKDTTSY